MSTVKPIPGYEGLYEITDGGQVRSCERRVPSANRFGPMLKLCRAKPKATYLDRDGYVAVSLCKDGQQRSYRVSRLVLAAFDRSAAPGDEACHRNHDKADNSIGNLEWGSRQQNEDAKTQAGRRPATTVSGLTAQDASEIRSLKAQRCSYRDIADKYGLHWTSIYNVVKGKTWRTEVA